jgi:hypothetical protein
MMDACPLPTVPVFDWLDTDPSSDAVERMTAAIYDRRAGLVEAIAGYEHVCSTTLDQSRLKLQ